MSTKLDHLGGGTAHQFPISAFGRVPGASRDTVTEAALFQAIRYRRDVFQDFNGDLSAADIGIPGSLYDLSPAGTPTQALVANGDHGQLQIKLTNDNQQSIAGYYEGNQLTIPCKSRPYFETRFGFHALPTTNEGAIFGLVSAFSGAALTDWSQFTNQITFQLSASGLLRYRIDDGTTDTGLVSTGQTLVADTWYTASFFASPNGNVEFWLADQYGANDNKIATGAAAALKDVTTNLQQIFVLKKDSGAGTPDVRVDYIWTNHTRTTSTIS